MARPKKIIKAAHGVDVPPGYVADGDYYRPETSQAQSYAMRVWNGQSVSLFRKERVERVERALAGQGFTAEEIAAVVLPE